LCDAENDIKEEITFLDNLIPMDLGVCLQKDNRAIDNCYEKVLRKSKRGASNDPEGK